MSDLICITNRKLCSNNFLDQIEMIASAHPKAIVLREKDLSEKEYEQLARQVMQICQKHGTQCILHSFSNVATTLGATAVHMPLPLLQKMTPQEKSHFQIFGASCHSLEEAKEAQRKFDEACGNRPKSKDSDDFEKPEKKKKSFMDKLKETFED